jgi:hypothetical protein
MKKYRRLRRRIRFNVWLLRISSKSDWAKDLIRKAEETCIQVGEVLKKK